MMKWWPVLTAAMIGGLSVGPARALPGRDVEVDFFAERELTTQVGTLTKPCGTGSAHMVGHRTPFYVRSSSSCQSGSHVPTTISCHFTDAGCSADVARRGAKKVHRPARVRHS